MSGHKIKYVVGSDFGHRAVIHQQYFGEAGTDRWLFEKLAWCARNVVRFSCSSLDANTSHNRQDLFMPTGQETISRHEQCRFRVAGFPEEVMTLFVST